MKFTAKILRTDSKTRVLKCLTIKNIYCEYLPFKTNIPISDQFACHPSHPSTEQSANLSALVAITYIIRSNMGSSPTRDEKFYSIESCTPCSATICSTPRAPPHSAAIESLCKKCTWHQSYYFYNMNTAHLMTNDKNPHNSAQRTTQYLLYQRGT